MRILIDGGFTFDGDFDEFKKAYGVPVPAALPPEAIFNLVKSAFLGHSVEVREAMELNLTHKVWVSNK